MSCPAGFAAAVARCALVAAPVFMAPEALALQVEGKCAVELVEHMKASAVAPRLIHGEAMQSIAKLESGESRESVVGAYLKRWRATQAVPLDARVVSEGRWLIVSKIIGNCLHTVQLDKGSLKASGYVSARSLDADRPDFTPGKGFPKLYNSTVVSDMTHDDPGKKARTLMISNRFSVEANAEFYLKAVAGQGWQAVSDHRLPMRKSAVAARALTFRKGGEQQIIVITEAAAGSNVVAQWMEKP